MSVEKLFMKWFVDSSPVLQKPEGFCWHLRDQIFEESNLPSLNVDTEGTWLRYSVSIERLDPSCSLRSQDPNVEIVNSATGLVLKMKVPMPFARFNFSDNTGRSLELFFEGKIRHAETSDFLSFFKDSVFAARLTGIKYDIFQFPFLHTKYELPTLLNGRVALQIALGQSLFDFSGGGIRQGYYELALAAPVAGSRLPYTGPWSLRLKLAYEGNQINDQKGLAIYPLLATQMMGGGIESFFRFNEAYGFQFNSGVFFSQTPIARLMKISNEGSFNYSVNQRWRLEAGLKWNHQRVNRTDMNAVIGFNEMSYFLGVQVKPYLIN